jgi:multiple sugar transport system substrate-binding protein
MPMIRRTLMAAVALAALVIGTACATALVPSAPQPGQQPGASASPAARNYPPPLRPDQQVTIRFENYNLASAGIGREATLRMIADFEKKFPNIKVETKATRDQEIFPSVQAQVVAGDTPDVVQLLLREWDLNVENLPITPLEQIVSPEEFAEYIRGEHAYHPRALALTQRNGLTYGMSYVFSTPTLFYNATLFQEAGLDPNRPPQTWDQVAQYAKQIKDRTGNDGLYIACIELDWCTQGILLSNGARFMNEDRTRIMFGEAPAIEVFRFWQGMVQNGAHSRLAGADASTSFQAGKIGMFLQTSAVQGSFISAARGKWDLRTSGMPSFGTRPAVPVNSGSGLAIFSKDPAKQRASWELVKYFTSEEAFQIITTEVGYLPLRPGMVDDPKYLLNWPNRDLIMPNIRQLDQLEPSLSFPGQNHLQIRTLFLNTLQRVLFQNEDPQRAFTEAATRAQSLMPASR